MVQSLFPIREKSYGRVRVHDSVLSAVNPCVVSNSMHHDTQRQELERKELGCGNKASVLAGLLE